MYYQPDGKKSNINVFTGKEAKLNNAILEKLVFGPKTTMELAKLISEDGQKAKQTFSVIARKGGALDRLAKMGFIVREEDKTWSLMTKGHLYALLLLKNKGRFEEVLHAIPPELINEIKETISPLKKMFKKTPFAPLFEQLLQKVDTKQVLFNAVEVFEDLLRQGVDLKKISNESLETQIATELALRLVAEGLKKGPSLL